ncbi:MAG: SHOCT domain-containing protein [Eubacteriales bacterium]|nr:SHOCT domain-containing protein [Eubacteriales bacterium]
MMNNSISGLASLCTRTFGGRSYDGRSMMDGFYGSNYGWVGMIGQGLFGLAILALFIVLIVWLIRLAKRAGNSSSQNNFGSTSSYHVETASALKLLNDRYAKGEISEEEYLKVKKNLTE